MEGTDQLPQSYRSVTKVRVSLQCFTELLLPPWEKKIKIASHVACVKICEVKSAVISVETQQKNNSNKNPKAT